jgi:transcriptional regulator with XRE-family HTH domain
MPESFGTRLRQQRERQQIALASIATQTKISLSLLEGLERDDVSHWPAGIFRRAFIRAYAHAIGLEADAVVREFLDHYPDPVGDIASITESSLIAGGESDSQGPPTRLQCVIASTLARFRKTDRPESTSASVAAGDRGPAKPTVQREPSLSAAAHLCTKLARVEDTREMAPLLDAAAGILGAVGLIVWVWDPHGTALKPALAHGYGDEVLAQLPRVRRDADNATAAAFRSARTCLVNGSDAANGAVVVPLMTAGGCVGAFAVELPKGGEKRESVRALATIFAAQLATLFAYTPLAEAVSA